MAGLFASGWTPKGQIQNAAAWQRERIGIPRFIVSRVLNQISDTGGAAAVTAVYDWNEYLREKRRALDAWADLLGEIVSGEVRARNVVELGRRVRS